MIIYLSKKSFIYSSKGSLTKPLPQVIIILPYVLHLVLTRYAYDRVWSLTILQKIHVHLSKGTVEKPINVSAAVDHGLLTESVSTQPNIGMIVVPKKDVISS